MVVLGCFGYFGVKWTCNTETWNVHQRAQMFGYICLVDQGSLFKIEAADVSTNDGLEPKTKQHEHHCCQRGSRIWPFRLPSSWSNVWRPDRTQPNKSWQVSQSVCNIDHWSSLYGAFRVLENSARGGDANVPTALRIVMTMTGVWPSESTGPGVIRTPRMTGVERILPGGEGCNDSEELSRAHVYVIDRSWIRGQPFHGFRLVGSWESSRLDLTRAYRCFSYRLFIGVPCFPVGLTETF